MKRIILSIVVGVALIVPGYTQDKAITEKLSSFFFGLPFGVDIEMLRTKLRANPDFKFYDDPNRDARKTIVGSMRANENLNPLSMNNQVIVQYSSAEAKKRKKVSLKWSMNYKLEDLPSASVDFEKLKNEFSPLFSSAVETKKTGAQKEMISSLVLKEESITVIIILIEYINFSHSVSLEYQDTWKIQAADTIKAKH